MSLRLEWIGLLLVVLGVLRAAVLVGHQPVMAYANQYDMHRTGACLGLFPAIERDARYRATPGAPIAKYRFEAPREGCYPGTELALIVAASHLAQAAGFDPVEFPIRFLGFVKLLLFGGTAIAFGILLRRCPLGALLHGSIVLLVMSDPTVTLWANGLYSEFVIAWSLYATIGAICILALQPRDARLSWVLLFIALAALAFSKEQFALLPLAIATVAFPWLWFRSHGGAATTLIVALCASVASAVLVSRPEAVHWANRTNAYLATIVPAAPNVESALAKLGLPPRCKVVVGASWYLQRGEHLEQACPEVFRLSSIAFLRFADEPLTLARSLARILPATQHVIPPYLGVLEGRNFASVSELGVFGASPWHFILSRLPVVGYAALSLAMFLLAPLALVAALAWARPAQGQPRVSLLLAMLLGGVALHAFITTVFGDGMSEAGRHYWSGHLATCSAFLALLVTLPTIVFDWLRSPRDSATKILAASFALATICLAVHLSWNWAKQERLAIGVLDEPAGRKVPNAGFSLKGWALDPFGVANVRVELGRLTLRTRYGEAASPDLHAHFPGYPDAHSSRFLLDVTAEELARAGEGPEIQMRIVVENRIGVVTPIEGRRLERGP